MPCLTRLITTSTTIHEEIDLQKLRKAKRNKYYKNAHMRLVVLESIFQNHFGLNFRIKPNFVKTKFCNCDLIWLWNPHLKIQSIYNFYICICRYIRKFDQNKRMKICPKSLRPKWSFVKSVPGRLEWDGWADSEVSVPFKLDKSILPRSLLFRQRLPLAQLTQKSRVEFRECRIKLFRIKFRESWITFWGLRIKFREYT
jgi:hypothetical protein